MGQLKLNNREKKAISELQRLADDWPESLWLFAASGDLNVMKKNADNERAFYSVGGGVDEKYIVAEANIPCDGGDW